MANAYRVGKKSNNVVIREYYGIFNGFRPLAEVIAFDVRSYVKLGVMEYTSELNPDENFLFRDGVIRGGGAEWDFMTMEAWVVNRIYWDDTQDVEQLRKYYLRRTYREAAPDDAYVLQPDGSVRVGWTLKKPLDSCAVWSLEESRGVSPAFELDEAQAKQSHVYYLTDYLLQQNNVSTDAR